MESSNIFKWNAFYRAKVIDSVDEEKRGRVKVWIPDVMPEVDDSKGLWAKPANNPLGGRNSESDGNLQYFQGTCYIPAQGSWVFVFFENGNPNVPYYFASGEFGQSKVPVECQQGGQYWNKQVIYKSRNGRTIIVSDDPDDERLELTGKKRNLSSSDVSGNPESVYAIDGNQTVILIDERSGNEKILIKDYKGNFIHIDTENDEIHINGNSDLHANIGGSAFIQAEEDIHLKGKNLYFEAEESINIKAGQMINYEADQLMNIKSGGDLNINGEGNINILADGNIAEDGSTVLTQQGAATPAASASSASNASVNGDRQDPSTGTIENDPQYPTIVALPPTVIINDEPPE